MNLNVTHEGLRVGLGETAQGAISLLEALGRPVDRNAFTARFLTCLERRFDIYRARGAPAILAEWRNLDVVTGRLVEIRDGSTALAGRALGVDAEGHLRVKDARQRIHTVVSGQVHLIR